MFGFKFKKQKEQKTKGSFFKGVSKVKEFIAHTMVKEVIPGDRTITGKAHDYLVEIGETAQLVRYCRSFFSQFTGISTWAGMMDQLYLSEFGNANCDVAIHIKPSKPDRIISELTRELAGIESDYYNEKNEIKRTAMLDQIHDLREQIGRLRKEVEKMHSLSIQVTVSSDDLEKLDRFCSIMVKRYAGKSVFMRAADNRQLDVLMMSTPLDEKEVFKDTFRNVESSCVADMFPFGHGTIRHRSGIILGRDPYGKPVFFDAWHPNLKNANMVVFGQSGSGKSFAVKTITERSAVIGIRTAIIDYEGEFENLVKWLGCPYIKLSENSKYRINIFDVDISETKEDGSDTVTKKVMVEHAVNAVLAVVVQMVSVIDPGLMSGMAKIKLQEAIKQLYTERGITETPESLYKIVRIEENGVFKTVKQRKPLPTLHDLYKKIKANEDMAEVAAALKMFTREGPLRSQAIFDGESNFEIEDAPIFAISVKGLDNTMMKPIGLFVTTKWIWEKFANKNIDVQKRIVIDEAQNAMNDELASEWLISAFSTARKRNVSMCAITQGFEVFMNKPGANGTFRTNISSGISDGAEYRKTAQQTGYRFTV